MTPGEQSEERVTLWRWYDRVNEWGPWQLGPEPLTGYIQVRDFIPASELARELERLADGYEDGDVGRAIHYREVADLIRTRAKGEG